MSIAAAQAQRFYEQVAQQRRVFTFLNDDAYLVFKIDKVEVVPFWSSKTRLDRVKKAHPKYRDYEPDEISLESFIDKTLPQLREEEIHIGLNWSGVRLVGYDISANDLVTNLKYWLSRQ